MRLAVIANILPSFCRSDNFIEQEKCCIQGLLKSGITIVEEEDSPDRALLIFDGGVGSIDVVNSLYKRGIPSSPSLKSMEFYRKKMAQNKAVSAAGVLAPKTMKIGYGTSFEEVASSLGVPFCTKPDCGYGSAQLRFVRNHEDFHPRSGFIAQQVVGRPGIDISVALVKNEPVAAFKRVNQDHSTPLTAYGNGRRNLFPDCVFEKYHIDQEIKTIAEKIATVFENELSMVNLLISRNGILYFNELNQMANLVNFQKLCNVNPYELYGRKIKDIGNAYKSQTGHNSRPGK